MDFLRLFIVSYREILRKLIVSCVLTICNPKMLMNLNVEIYIYTALMLGTLGKFM